MSFTQLNLNPSITKAVQACGYTQLTPIQEKTIPVTLGGSDLVASAETGSGKTAAFVLPALERVSKVKGGAKPRILILTPTRELASQITQAAGKYGKFLNLNIVSLVGGMPYRQQLRDLSRPVDIIVATPGRLLDHMQKQKQKLDLSKIEMLILDEADRMLDMGFIDDVKEISRATPDNRQTLLFSATVDDRLAHIIRQLLKNPVRIDLSHEKLAPAQILQKMYLADNAQHKMRLLQHFINEEQMYKAIIFSATKINADKLTKLLNDQGHSVAALHGDLKQNVRNRTVEQLRRGKIQYLVATDVAARGIDIQDITHVINYDLPKFSEDYVHRIGRTGRAGKTGTAISFALPTDKLHLQRIERFTKQKLEVATIAGLEPTQNFDSNSTKKKAKRGKKKFSNKEGGFSKNFQGRDRGNSSSKNVDRKNKGSNQSRSFDRRGDGDSTRFESNRGKERGFSAKNNEERSYSKNIDERNSRGNDFSRSSSKNKDERGYTKSFDSRSDRGSDRSRGSARNKDERSFSRHADSRNDRGSDRARGFARSKDETGYSRHADSRNDRGSDRARGFARSKDETGYSRNGDSRNDRGSDRVRGFARSKDETGYSRNGDSRNDRDNDRGSDRARGSARNKDERSYSRGFDTKDNRGKGRDSTFSGKERSNSKSFATKSGRGGNPSRDFEGRNKKWHPAEGEGKKKDGKRNGFSRDDNRMSDTRSSRSSDRDFKKRDFDPSKKEFKKKDPQKKFASDKGKDTKNRQQTREWN